MLDIGDPVDMHGADSPHSKRDLGDQEVVPGAGTDGADLQINAWSLQSIVRPRNRRRAPRPHPSSDTATSVDYRRQTTMHTDPFILKLTGPAGGTYARDTTSAGNCIKVDAIDCCGSCLAAEPDRRPPPPHSS
jgi:hypothetical protein